MGRAAVRGTVRSPLGLIVVVSLAVVAGVVIIAPLVLRSHADAMDATAIQQGMSSRHPFGTDRLGRDILERTLVASRTSVLLALATTACACVFGAVLGALPVVVGRRAGRLIVAGINVCVAFPGLLIALFLSMVFGVGAGGAVLALALALTPGFARLTHTTASAVAGSDYVSAARLLGVSRTRVLLRHVLPNIAEPLVVTATTIIGTALLALSALSYLGFGVQPPSYDWGQLLSDGLNDIYTSPAAALLPGAAIVLTGAAFILAGEVVAQIAAGQAASAQAGGTRHKGAPARRSAARAEPGPAPGSAAASGEAAAGAAGDACAEDACAGHGGCTGERSTGEGSSGGSYEAAGDPVLRLEDLTVAFPDRGTRPVRGVSFSLDAGEIVGIVGESGSGKSLSAAALGWLLPHPGTADATRMELCGRELQRLAPGERNRLLGRSLATVFQNPMSAMNPAVRVGLQLAEVSQVHQGLPRRAAMARAVGRLASVGIGAAAQRARQYPGKFSGGMRQRAMIAMSLMAEPAVIIADEPTTALDANVQREVLALLRGAAAERRAAVLFISHDIAVVSEIASRVLVMYAGRIVEELPTALLAGRSAHPYTRALVASVPDLATDRSRPLASVDGRPPDPGEEPSGCAFAARCPLADAHCRAHRPPLAAVGDGQRVACWKPRTGDGGADTERGSGRIGSRR